MTKNNSYRRHAIGKYAIRTKAYYNRKVRRAGKSATRKALATA